MSSIKVDIDGVLNINNGLNQNISRVSNIRSGIQSVRHSLDNRILSRRSIGGRLNNASSDSNNIEIKIKNLQSFIDTSMNRYSMANSYLNKLASQVGEITRGFSVTDGHYDISKRLGDILSIDALVDKENGSDGNDDSIFDIHNKYAGYTADLVGRIEMFLKSYKALTSGFNIVQVGNYYIIKGSIKFRTEVAKIPGTRYRVGSALSNQVLGKYINPDTSISAIYENFKSNVNATTLKGAVKGTLRGTIKESYVFEKGNKIGSAGIALGYIATGLEVADGISNNMKNGQTKATKYVADATVDIAKGLGGMAIATGATKIGAAIGTAIPVPVVGTVVGAAGGFIVGSAVSMLYEKVINGFKINEKTIADHAKDGTKWALDKTVDVGKNIYNGAANVAKDVGKAIGNRLESAGSKVGNGFNSTDRALSGAFS